MVVSMTGYGQGKRQTDTFSITIEVKTVNHRFTEYFLRIPKQFLKLEDKIKKTLNQYIKRGRIEVYATIEQTGSKQKKIRVDWDLLDEFYRSMTEVKEKYKLSSEPGLKDLLNEDVFAIVEVDEEDEWLDELILEATNEAGKELQMMRLAEGKELEKDLLNSSVY